MLDLFKLLCFFHYAGHHDFTDKLISFIRVVEHYIFNYLHVLPNPQLLCELTHLAKNLIKRDVRLTHEVKYTTHFVLNSRRPLTLLTCFDFSSAFRNRCGSHPVDQSVSNVYLWEVWAVESATPSPPARPPTPSQRSLSKTQLPLVANRIGKGRALPACQTGGWA